MTDQELKDIVSAVVAELEKSGVDFDYKAEQAKDDDLVFIIRGTAPDYQGVTVTWKGLLDIITAQATQAKNDAETAKNAANTILEQVQSKGTEITNFVATSKAELETQKNESVNAVKSVYQTDLNELKGDLSDVEDKIAPIDFRQKSTGKAILDVDITGTMEAFMDGMEQEPNEAIALTLEPDVPTVESHNFGVRGQICIDGNYLYVCVADNTWKKIALQEL